MPLQIHYLRFVDRACEVTHRELVATAYRFEPRALAEFAVDPVPTRSVVIPSAPAAAQIGQTELPTPTARASWGDFRRKLGEPLLP